MIDYRLSEGRTGFAELRRLRASLGSSIPVLVVTAETSTEAIRDIADAGLERLEKPFDSSALKGWLIHATTPNCPGSSI